MSSLARITAQGAPRALPMEVTIVEARQEEVTKQL